MKTQSTTNYSQFVANSRQRKFTPAHVKKIAAKIKKNGFTPSMAISVFKNKDGKLHINTGHHRLAACMLLGVPVLYVIEHEWTTSELVDEGTSGKAWGSLASAQAYADEGDQNYIVLLEYTNKGIAMRYAASLLRGEHAASGNAIEAVSNGTFKIKTTKYIDEVVMVVDSLKDKSQEAQSMTFVSALSALMNVHSFSSTTLVKKVQMLGCKIEKCKTRDQMLDQLEEIYNYQGRIKQPLAFLAKESLRVNQVKFGK